MDALSVIQAGQVDELQKMVDQVNQGFGFFHTAVMGTPVLHWAVQSKQNSLEMLKILVESKLVELDCKDGDGATALHWAAEADNLPAAQYLISLSKSLLSTPDHMGELPLHWASLKGNPRMIHFFVRNYPGESLINAQNDEGNTALHNAAINQHKDSIALLIGADASADTLNKQKKKPLDLCDEEIRKLFQDKDNAEQFIEQVKERYERGISQPTETSTLPLEGSTPNGLKSSANLENPLPSSTQLFSPTQNMDWEEERKKYQLEIENLKHQLSQSSSGGASEKKIKDLEQEIQFLQEDLQETSLENLKLKQEIGTQGSNETNFIEDLQQDNHKQKKQIHCLEETVRDLQDENEQYLEDIDKLKKEVEELRKQQEQQQQDTTPAPQGPVDPTVLQENQKYMKELEESNKILEKEYREYKKQTELYNTELEEKLRKFEQKEREVKPADFQNTSSEDFKYIRALEIKVRVLQNDLEDLQLEFNSHLDTFQKISSLAQVPLKQKKNTGRQYTPQTRKPTENKAR